MSLFQRKRPVVRIRGLHLDLKGLPPTRKRLFELLDLIASVRINCLVVEWEDVYPWRKYPELQSESVYSAATVKQFLARARELSIQVIPLIQSLGHMENILSKKKFAHLREVTENVGELCPCKAEGRELVLEMIEDILDSHDGITHFHLGGDEAWSMGSCARCKEVVQKHGKAYLYLKHVLPLIDALEKKGVRAVLWDDMMRNWSMSALRKVSSKADLMVWSYKAEPLDGIGENRISRKILSRYNKANIVLWGASAFKGADGFSSDLPDMKNRRSNLIAWVNEAKQNNFVGLVATGWSRYNTFRAPCEGLESALDGLVLAGASMWDGSLPEDSVVSARAFLNSGKLKELAGKRFLSCLKASQELKVWRANTMAYLESISSLAHIAGEPNRKNSYEEKRAIVALRNCLHKGKQYGCNWIKAHRGLVPNIWLERYIDSRLLPMERFARAILNELGSE